MRRIRRRLTYANLMATLAVFIALGGGAYAALQLPKNSVKSKQIKNRSVKRVDLHSGVLSGTVVASARANSLPGKSDTNPVSLSGRTTFTPAAGRPNLVMLDVRATTADTGGSLCQPVVSLAINGESVGAAFLGVGGTTLTSTEDAFANPWGLARPGVAQHMTVRVQGDSDCSASSMIDSIRLAVSRLG
jgi:hypothetical protein